MVGTPVTNAKHVEADEFAGRGGLLLLAAPVLCLPQVPSCSFGEQPGRTRTVMLQHGQALEACPQLPTVQQPVDDRRYDPVASMLGPGQLSTQTDRTGGPARPPLAPDRGDRDVRRGDADATHRGHRPGTAAASGRTGCGRSRLPDKLNSHCPTPVRGASHVGVVRVCCR